MKFKRKKYKGKAYVEASPKGVFLDDLGDMSLLIGKCLKWKICGVVLYVPKKLDLTTAYQKIGTHLIERFGSYGIRIGFVITDMALTHFSDAAAAPTGRQELWEVFTNKKEALDWLFK
ncbi:hypothetical protein KAR04_04685 [Candidatus Calescamantes bacterium]|nr:hypothetical protein [Candidatus Calescamantes bacterium]MCK5598653.1 hypothetical protein [bacterium]